MEIKCYVYVLDNLSNFGLTLASHCIDSFVTCFYIVKFLLMCKIHICFGVIINKQFQL